MSVFQRVREMLGRDRTYAADVKPLMDFASIDAAKICTDLQIDARGKERGRRNDPPSDFPGLDQVELEVVGSVETLRNEAYENFSKQMSVYDGRLARVDLRTIVPDVKTMLHDAEADFGAEVRKDTNPVFAKRAELVTTEVAYESFRKENDLTRLADPERNPILATGILFVIFVLETAANSGFFSATHPGGLLGAVFEAAGISLINLAVGFALGIIPLRYVRLPAIFWKISMAIVAAALVALALTFNFFAAHYRDAFSVIPPDAENFMREVIEGGTAKPTDPKVRAARLPILPDGAGRPRSGELRDVQGTELARSIPRLRRALQALPGPIAGIHFTDRRPRPQPTGPQGSSYH